MEDSLAIVNARIWTANPDRPRASGLFIEDGMIRSDGASESVIGRAASVIDCENRVVTPGLIDTHTHFVMGGESLSQLDLSGARSRAEFDRAIATRAADHTSETAWLIAHGWNNENWGGEMPDKSWLIAAGARPAVAYRMDSHVCIANEAAMKFMRIPNVDAPGGRTERAKDGSPTGLFVEAAAWEIVNPAVPPMSVEAKRAAVLAAQQHAHSFGLTTIGTMEYSQTVRDVLEPLRDALSLRLRITLLDRDLPIDFDFARSFQNDDHLAIIGFKAFLDGTLGSRTAKMLQPYCDDAANDGLWVELAERGELQQWYEAVCDGGFQPAMHAIGDAAVRMAIETIERGGAARRRRRPRIEHAQQIDPADLRRFKGGVIASMQPLHRADDGRFAEKRVGRDRMAGFFPFQSLRQAGAQLAFGSDWPIVSCDPVLGIRAAVTGLTTEDRAICTHETLLIEEAMRANTTDAAFALCMEDRTGTIAVDRLADLVVWERDPFTADWGAQPPRVAMTIAGGRVVFGEE